MERSRRNWVYVGRSGIQAGALVRTCVTATLRLARAVLPQRVLEQRWIRYRVDLTGPLPPVAPDVRLTRVTDDLIDRLRHHPEQAENQLRSGLRFWERGLRRAYIWLGEDGPLCIQWLLTEADGRRLHRLGDWAGMYPPLPPRTGQVENLFAFASARKQGVASRFEYALYQEARRLGMAELVTHIHETKPGARTPGATRITTPPVALEGDHATRRTVGSDPSPHEPSGETRCVVPCHPRDGARRRPRGEPATGDGAAHLPPDPPVSSHHVVRRDATPQRSAPTSELGIDLRRVPELQRACIARPARCPAGVTTVQRAVSGRVGRLGVVCVRSGGGKRAGAGPRWY